MPQCLYLNRTECAVLATALNATKLISYPEHQRGLIEKVGRRIANFLIDGQTAVDDKAAHKKRLVTFADTGATDEEWKQQYLELTESVAATLRGEKGIGYGG